MKEIRQNFSKDGGNHNIFYQNPNLYPPLRMPHGALVANDEAEIGVQPNMTNLTPAMQSHYAGPGYNEQQRFYSRFHDTGHHLASRAR